MATKKKASKKKYKAKGKTQAEKNANVYKALTAPLFQTIQTAIENDDILPWERGWNYSGAQRGIDGNIYRGWNQMGAMLIGMTRGYKSPIWATKNRVKKEGGRIADGKWGESISIVKWTFIKDEDGETKFAYPRYWNVFNGDVIEGIDLPVYDEPLRETQGIEAAEEVINDMQNRPAITFQNNVTPAYIPMLDTVRMPDIRTYDDDERYYASFFHELGHSCSHKSRLNRDKLSFDRDDPRYMREELAAQMTAAFAMARLGIEFEAEKDPTPGYLQGWLSGLKNDPSALVKAAGDAQKRVEYIFNDEVEGEDYV